MKEKKKKDQPPKDEAPVQPPKQDEPQQAQAEAQGTEPTEALQRERDELQQRLLRVSADYQNYVRRSQSDVSTAKQQQLISMARELVTVLDHFDHALEMDPQKTSTESLMKGVVMVRDELMRALSRFGVERIDVAVGEAFDPNRHEAMMHQPSEDVQPNHVAAQLQPGYAIDNKTIRPAKVAVAQ